MYIDGATPMLAVNKNVGIFIHYSTDGKIRDSTVPLSKYRNMFYLCESYTDILPNLSKLQFHLCKNFFQ